MLLTSFMTGVAFAKLARPHPSIIFSSVSRRLECLEMNVNGRDLTGAWMCIRHGMAGVHRVASR